MGSKIKPIDADIYDKTLQRLKFCITYIKLLSDSDRRVDLTPALLSDITTLLENIKTIRATRHNVDGKEGEISEIEIFFSNLVNAIYLDFMNNKDKTLILLLAEHHQSPLSITAIEQHAQTTTPRSNNTLIAAVRSRRRAALHRSIFNRSPHVLLSAVSATITDPRIKAIILSLTTQRAIINNKVYHWTTTENFMNILRNKAFYGNNYLTTAKIAFVKNALEEGDEKNGDGNVICLCPALVDYKAIFSLNNVRNNLACLTLDLDRTHVPYSGGNNNEFFKCFDFHAPAFSTTIKITPSLTIVIAKPSRGKCFLTITVKLNQFTFTTNLNKEDAIYYGNLRGVNRFCLLLLFKILQQAQALDVFMAYLSTLTDNEIKKIMVIFAQGLTLFSEYNFNTVLPVTPGLITEAYFYDQNTTLKFTNQTQLDDFAEQRFNSLSFVDELDPPFVINVGYYQRGRQCTDTMSETIDMSLVSAEIFANDQYVETRYGNGKLLKEPLLKGQKRHCEAQTTLANKKR